MILKTKNVTRPPLPWGGAGSRLFLFLLLLLMPLSLLAQNIEVQGTVTDAATGEEIIGATVKVKGFSSGTVTDFNGQFRISVKQGETLEVSYVGYKTQQVKVTNANINIRLA